MFKNCCTDHYSEMMKKPCVHKMMPYAPMLGGLMFMGVSMIAHAVMFKAIYCLGIKKAKLMKTKMKDVHIENLKVDNLEVKNKHHHPEA